MRDNLVLYHRVHGPTRDPAHIAAGCRFAAYGISLCQIFKGRRSVLQFFEDNSSDRVCDPIAEEGGIDEYLADMVEFIWRLAEYLDQVPATFGAKRAIDFPFG